MFITGEDIGYPSALSSHASQPWWKDSYTPTDLIELEPSQGPYNNVCSSSGIWQPFFPIEPLPPIEHLEVATSIAGNGLNGVYPGAINQSVPDLR